MTETESIEVGGGEMEILIARPQGPGPHPGLIMGNVPIPVEKGEAGIAG